MTISVDRLVTELKGLNIDHQAVEVLVQVDVQGVPHRLHLGSMQITDSGIVLVGDPLPVPDLVIAPVPGVTVEDDHVHAWVQDPPHEQWNCIAGGGCRVFITFAELIKYPAPALEADGMELLDALAANDSGRILATLNAIAESKDLL